MIDAGRSILLARPNTAFCSLPRWEYGATWPQQPEEMLDSLKSDNHARPDLAKQFKRSGDATHEHPAGLGCTNRRACEGGGRHPVHGAGEIRPVAISAHVRDKVDRNRTPPLFRARRGLEKMAAGSSGCEHHRAGTYDWRHFDCRLMLLLAWIRIPVS